MNLLTFDSFTEGKYRLSKFPIDSYLGLPPDVLSLEMLMQLQNRCHSSCHHSVEKQPCDVTRQWMTMDHISKNMLLISIVISIFHDPLTDPSCKFKTFVLI